MEELKKLVDALAKKQDEGEQIKILQDIGAKLINEYEIHILDLIVKPLWVEAYYYNPDHFPDCNTHMSEKQKGKEHFGHIYFHKTGHGGFDLCLPRGNYYLSFLLKATLVNETFCTQTDIYDFVDKSDIPGIESKPDVVHKRDKADTHQELIYTKRVNLTKPCYVDAPLAVVPKNALGMPKYDFTFAHKSLTNIVVGYMKDYIDSNPYLSKKDYKSKCTEVFGWCPDAVDKLLK